MDLINKPGFIKIYTAVMTPLGAGLIIGHTIDEDHNISGYLVSFDYLAPGSMSKATIIPSTGWEFRRDQIKILSREVNNVY